MGALSCRRRHLWKSFPAETFFTFELLVVGLSPGSKSRAFVPDIPPARHPAGPRPIDQAAAAEAPGPGAGWGRPGLTSRSVHCK